MLPILGNAWRFIVRRAAANRLILVAAMMTIVLATVLLAAGPIYANAVTLGALQRTLGDMPADEANVEISIRVKTDGYAAAEEIVVAEIDRTFGSVGGKLSRKIVSESYELPDQSGETVIDIAVFQYLQNIEVHATLAEGAWPERTASPYQAAILQSVATDLGLSTGDELTLANRRDPTEQRSIVIVGVYTIDDAEDPFWFNDPLAINGVTHSSSFETHGPFVVDFQTALFDLATVNVDARWRVFPDYAAITIDDVPTLRSGVQVLEQRLNSEVATAISFRVGAPLGSILAQTERSLLVTKSGVLMLSIQLSIIAGLALVLTAGLLVESRRVETDLLRSRGASSGQVLAVAVVEAALLTLPTALAAPWLATVALGVLDRVGPLAEIGLTLDPRPSGIAYLLSLLAAVGCTAALAAPAYRSAESFNESYSARGRQRRTSRAQKTGVDVALVALAAVAFWQLRVHGSAITATVQGRFGIDPLLVTAPALALLASAVLALRVIPLLARTAEVIAGVVRGPVPALSSWQVARRPVRYARSALLTVMAINIGFFAASYTTVWTQSQDDQAAFDVGSDIRVFPNHRINDSIGDLYLQQAHSKIEAVSESMPVVRMSGGGSRTASIKRFVILDAKQAGNVVLIREDLGPEFAGAMEELAGKRPSLATVPLPGEPQRVAVALGVEVEPLPDEFEKGAEENLSVCFCPSVRLVVQDGDGFLHRVDLGEVPVDSGLARIATDLVVALGDGTEVEPRYPLALVDVEVRSPTPLDIARDASITFGGVYVSDAAEGETWNLATVDLASTSWELNSTFVARASRQPTISPGRSGAGGAIEFDLSTGQAFGGLLLPAFFSVRPAGTELPATFPIVVTDRLLKETATKLGDEMRLRSLGILNDHAEIVATVEMFPTINPSTGEAVLIDLPTFQMMAYESGRQIPQADEHWIRTGDRASSEVTEALLAAPYESFRVVDRAGVADDRKTDPVALGTMGSMALGFISAAVFAAVGFAVSATVSARERVTEFALLRALGLSNRQLGLWLTLEQGVLVATSLALGTLIGLLLSWLILPLVSVTQAGEIPIPAVTVSHPWTTIMWLELAVVSALVITVIALAVLLRRMGLGSLLRLGEDWS